MATHTQTVRQDRDGGVREIQGLHAGLAAVPHSEVKSKLDAEKKAKQKPGREST